MKADLPLSTTTPRHTARDCEGATACKTFLRYVPPKKRVPGPHHAGLGGIKKELLLTKRETLKGSKVQTVW